MPEYIQYNAQGLIIQKWYSVDPSIVEGLQNILKIDRDTFNALTKYHIVDSGAVREMTQEEKDTYDAYLAQQAELKEKTRLEAMDDVADLIQTSDFTLTKIDTTIDNTLLVTAQWNTNNAGNSINSEIFTLNKIF